MSFCFIFDALYMFFFMFYIIVFLFCYRIKMVEVLNSPIDFRSHIPDEVDVYT